jgi:hypothetical protein
VYKQFTLAARVVSSNEKSASFVVIRIGLLPEADAAYDAGRQLRDVGKVVRKVVQETINKGSHGVENCLTLWRV